MEGSAAPGAEADGNPYAGTGETAGEWLYDIYEAYRGAERNALLETGTLTYLTYEMRFSRAGPGARRQHSCELRLPQCAGEDAFAQNFNRHYRERYDARLAEELAYWEAYPPASTDVEEFLTETVGRGLVLRDDYLWGGFYQVILDDIWMGGRVWHEPVVELFNAGTGALLRTEEAFAGPPEEWVPELARRLGERGMRPPTGAEEGWRRIQDGEIDFQRYAESVLEQGGTGGFSNLMLTPGGLGIAFPTGSVAANCAGPVVVVLPYGDAGGLLDPDLRESLLAAAPAGRGS